LVMDGILEFRLSEGMGESSRIVGMVRVVAGNLCSACNDFINGFMMSGRKVGFVEALINWERWNFAFRLST
jgi:hypothetical protein